MTHFLFSLVFFLTFSAGACPLGEKEDHLTIHRVMRNFGRFIMPAESIGLRVQNKNEVITDALLDEAIQKLSLVLSCANAVIENPTGDMIPDRGQAHEGDQKAEYLDDLNYFMNEFKDSVTGYQDFFIQQRAKAPADRHYEALRKLTEEQNELIDRAHTKL